MKTEIQYRFSRNTGWVIGVSILLMVGIILLFLDKEFDSEFYLMVSLFSLLEVFLLALLMQHLFFIITKKPALLIDQEYIVMLHFSGRRVVPIMMITSMEKARLPRSKQQMLSIKYIGKRNKPSTLGILDEYKMSLDQMQSVIEDARSYHNMTDEYGIEGVKAIKKEIESVTGIYYVIGVFTLYLLVIGSLVGIVLFNLNYSDYSYILAVMFLSQVLVMFGFAYSYYQRRISYKTIKIVLLIIALLSLIEIGIAIRLMFVN